MNKKTKKRLAVIASGLPKRFYKAKKYHFRKGSDLIKEGMKHLPSKLEGVTGELIQMDQQYKFTDIVERPTNHLKRLKRAYLRHGEKGIIMYINQFNQESKA